MHAHGGRTLALFDEIGSRISDPAVDICLDIATCATPEEVIVSGTVKDLVAGSGIAFEERTTRTCAGLGEWRLYAVTR